MNNAQLAPSSVAADGSDSGMPTQHLLFMPSLTLSDGTQAGTALVLASTCQLSCFAEAPAPRKARARVHHRTHNRARRIIRTAHSVTPAAAGSSGGSGGGGVVTREALNRAGRTKLNTADDRQFYTVPKLVKHVDEGFLAQVTQLYRCARLVCRSCLHTAMQATTVARLN